MRFIQLKELKVTFVISKHSGLGQRTVDKGKRGVTHVGLLTCQEVKDKGQLIFLAAGVTEGKAVEM